MTKRTRFYPVLGSRSGDLAIAFDAQTFPPGAVLLRRSAAGEWRRVPATEQELVGAIEGVWTLRADVTALDIPDREELSMLIARMKELDQLSDEEIGR